jgi:hypothetical protein
MDLPSRIGQRQEIRLKLSDHGIDDDRILAARL